VLVLENVDVSPSRLWNKIIKGKSDFFFAGEAQQIEHEHDDEHEHDSSKLRTPDFNYSYLVNSTLLQRLCELIADMRMSEAHAETEDLLLLRVNFPGLQIHAQWHTDPGNIHRCVEAALGEDVDQHRHGSGVLK